jgi:hypothetical protein
MNHGEEVVGLANWKFGHPPPEFCAWPFFGIHGIGAFALGVRADGTGALDDLADPVSQSSQRQGEFVHAHTERLQKLLELTTGETLIEFRDVGNHSGGSIEMLKLFDYKP